MPATTIISMVGRSWSRPSARSMLRQRWTCQACHPLSSRFPCHLGFIIGCAAVDVIVSDRLSSAIDTIPCVSPSSWTRSTANPDRGVQLETEWILLTSGTTGRPKLVVHTWQVLPVRLNPHDQAGKFGVRSTTFAYGGLQIFLRAALTGTSLMLSSARNLQPISWSWRHLTELRIFPARPHTGGVPS